MTPKLTSHSSRTPLLRSTLTAFGALLLSISISTSASYAEEANGEAKEAPKTPQAALNQDLSLFWGQKREVKVVQRRSYVKEGKLEVSLGGGIVPNDDFLLHYLAGARVGYYLTESFMVEGSFNMAFDQNSGLSTFLKESDIGLKEVLIREYLKAFYDVAALWSPIYGKFSFLGQKLTHFNLYVGLGVGLMHTQGYADESNPDLQPQTKPVAHGILGFRWHLTQMFSLRTEYRHMVFEQIGSEGGVSTPIALNLALSASF